MHCRKCDSTDLRVCERKITAKGIKKVRYRCKSCGSSFTTEDVNVAPGNVKRFVITSCQNDTDVHTSFLSNLEKYCEVNDAELLVFRLKYFYPSSLADNPQWRVSDEYLEDTLETETFKVLSGFKTNVSLANPLAGLDELSRGRHIIVPHTQLQMRTLNVLDQSSPLFAWTTGTISRPNYTDSKAGYKAAHNHSYSALFVEIKEGVTHIRVLNANGLDGSFYDLDKFYSHGAVEDSTYVEALITGDEHAVFADPDVVAATYTNYDSIVNRLRPKYIVRHDVLDFYAGCKYHEDNILLKYRKSITDTDNVEKELEETVNHILDTTPEFATSLIVASNHNDHLSQWLNSYDPKKDAKNARIYYELMYRLCENVDKGINKTPLEVFYDRYSGQEKVKFLGRNRPYLIYGIEIGQHGDVGPNGSRGASASFTVLANKHIIGHSHSPSINKGCYQVGTSTGRLGYARGYTSWANTHCIIYPNGTRQMITILNGKWC